MKQGIADKLLSNILNCGLAILNPLWKAKAPTSIQWIGTDFLSSMPEDVERKFNPYRRCITILNSVLESGKILRYIPQTVCFDMSGEISTHTVAFINIKRDEKMRPQTLYVFERMLGRLVVFLRLKNIIAVE